MAKTVLKVTILSCGKKAVDSTGKEYEIDFNFSSEEGRCKEDGEFFYIPETKRRGQVQANGKIEIL